MFCMYEIGIRNLLDQCCTHSIRTVTLLFENIHVLDLNLRELMRNTFAICQCKNLYKIFRICMLIFSHFKTNEYAYQY